jgi:hypothetical protein
MSADSYRPSSVRAIILGIIAFIILVSIFCGLAEVIKYAGAPFLIIPEKLGWIPEVNKDDVVTVNMNSKATQINFERTGDFVVYAYNYDLLVMTDELANANAIPWLKITNAQNGQSLPVDYVQKALTPFDSSHARGRPIFHFIVPEQGVYNIQFPGREVLIFFLPDQVTGNMGIILFCFVIQAVILAIPIGSIIRSRQLKQKAKLDEIRNLKTTSDEKFWQELKRQRNSQLGKPK